MHAPDRQSPTTIVDITFAEQSVVDTDQITYVTFHLDQQLFGFRIADVQEVFTAQQMTRVPLVSSAVKGLLNLRGRIVTALCLRTVLGMAAAAGNDGQMAIGVETAGETFALLVDRIGEVMKLPVSSLEVAPIHLDADWQGLTRGIHRLETSLLVTLHIDRIIGSHQLAA